MTNESPPAGIDVTRPSVARVYDYWLGGKDNFASDRAMGGRMAEVNPALPQLVRHNREFICAAAARAAAAGISQFLDLGSGLPAHPAVHEAVRQVIPDARVCYVDIDPAAAVHGAALLARGEGLAAVRADLTEAETVLADPRVSAVIDMSEPVAVILEVVPVVRPDEQDGPAQSGRKDRDRSLEPAIAEPRPCYRAGCGTADDRSVRALPDAAEKGGRIVLAAAESHDPGGIGTDW